MTNPELILSDLLKSTIALFIIIDPIGTVPIITELMKNMTTADKQKNLKTAAYTASALLIVFAFSAQQLLSFFSISIHSFMIAGGILLLLLSIDILIRDESSQRAGSAEDVGAVPIAFPLLVGPGAITTTIVILQSSGIFVTLAAIIIVMFVTWIVLKSTDKIYRLLGQNGSAVISRLMAIFVTAIAIQYILTGIQFYYPTR